MPRLSTTILELAPSPAKNPNLQRTPSNRKGAPSGKSLGRSREDRRWRTSVKAGKKQKKGRLDADPTNLLKHMVPPTGEHATPHATGRTRHHTAMMGRGAAVLRRVIACNWCRPDRQRTLQPSEKRDYRPSAFLREDTRRRETGIFSSTPSSVRSKVPPDWGSTSLTSARLTR